ncbi:MAG: M24 family metallopeptidase [Gammaproteobacteria bacterium]|nr:MAG: M24 family metallopeptidase [Gammaproteobacteria bacterium]
MALKRSGGIQVAYQKAFALTEYENRVARVKARMREAGFDLILCQDPANMCYLSGFDGWSFYTPQCLLVHVDEPSPIWFGRAQDARSARITTDLPTANIVSFSEPLVHHPRRHPYDELCQLISERGWADSSIGVELDAHYYTARAHRHLVDGLPAARIADNRELVNWVRLVKSKAEVAYMREAGQICSRAMNRVIEMMRPGVPQNEIIAAVYETQVLGLDGKFGDYTSLCPLIQVGEGTSTPHLTWSDEPLPENELVVMEIGAARRHYHAPLTRTMHLGKPPAEIERLASVIVDGVDAALEAARPGASCEAVEAVWQQVLKQNGYRKESRVGYSIGLNFPPDWGERTASLRPGDKTEMQPGMCFHFQSGVWLENFGAAVSEPFVVTEAGGERLCDVHRGLIVIE